jgi:hypothetical protein
MRAAPAAGLISGARTARKIGQAGEVREGCR